MYDGIAELDVLGRRHGVQVFGYHLQIERASASLHLQRHPPTNMTVQHVLQRHESRHPVAIDPDQDVTGLQQAGDRRTGHYALDHEHPGGLRETLPDGALRIGIEPEPPKLVIRRMDEFRQQRAARHGLVSAMPTTSPRIDVILPSPCLVPRSPEP